jgi:phosphoglucosamine mutase
MRTLFGTDGIRGVANRHPMTVEVAMQLGRAVAWQLTHGGTRRAKVVIGKDTRLSGYMFETALSAGLCSMGADVLLSGPLPTPGIAYLTTGMRADAGVVISASHNPYQDNGIKIFARDGFKLPDEHEIELERLISDPASAGALPIAERIGKAFKIDDAVGRYVVFLKERFPRELSLDGLKIVVDCAHGAAYRVAPALFSELGATVYPIGTTPNGTNINDHVGAVHPELLCKTVVERGAHLGIALDGDADRVIFSDEKGRVVDGDAVMSLCARQRLGRGTLAHNTVVATVMSNLGLDRAIKDLGGKVIRTQVGDRYVVEEMRRGGYNFGGEQSGHLIFLDHSSTGDGCIAALEVLAHLVRQNAPLSQLVEAYQAFPQVLVNLAIKERRELSELPTVQQAIAQAEEKLAGRGRVLVRYSGTELKARVMIEGEEGVPVRQLAEDIAAEMRRVLG